MTARAETMCRLAGRALADEPLPPRDGCDRLIRRPDGPSPGGRRMRPGGRCLTALRPRA
jgi:hypothetical protein